MGRLTVLVALVLTVTAFTNSGAGTAEAPQPHTYRVKLTIAGHEYESPQGDVLNDSRTQCPPSVNDPSVPARCWTWRGTHLGHGTFTFDAHYEPPDRFVGTFTLTSRRAVLYLGQEARVINDPTPSQALGHVNQFQSTLTVMEGTGRFAGIKGTLSGTFKTTVVEVDSHTGVVHRKAGGSVSGKLTFPARRPSEGDFPVSSSAELPIGAGDTHPPNRRCQACTSRDRANAVLTNTTTCTGTGHHRRGVGWCETARQAGCATPGRTE